MDSGGIAQPELVKERGIVDILASHGWVTIRIVVGRTGSQPKCSVSIERITPVIVDVAVVPGDTGGAIHCEDGDSGPSDSRTAGGVFGAGTGSRAADGAFTGLNIVEIKSLRARVISVHPNHGSPTGRALDVAIPEGALVRLSSGKIVVSGGIIRFRGDGTGSVESEPILVALLPRLAGVWVDAAIGGEVENAVLTGKLSGGRGQSAKENCRQTVR